MTTETLTIYKFDGGFHKIDKPKDMTELKKNIQSDKQFDLFKEGDENPLKEYDNEDILFMMPKIKTKFEIGDTIIMEGEDDKYCSVRLFITGRTRCYIKYNWFKMIDMSNSPHLSYYHLYVYGGKVKIRYDDDNNEFIILKHFNEFHDEYNLNINSIKINEPDINKILINDFIKLYQLNNNMTIKLKNHTYDTSFYKLFINNNYHTSSEFKEYYSEIPPSVDIQ